jgi:class 3 adenylate cyclase
MLSEVDLETLLTEHRQFVSRVAKAHDVRIVKAEGDGCWVVFASVMGRVGATPGRGT